MVVAILGPPILAATWFVLWVEWSEWVLLAVAIACAIPYGLGIGILLRMNYRQPMVWVIGVAAAIIWPGLFFMGLPQLLLAVPVWTVLFTHGSDLERPLSKKTILLALGLTGIVMFLMATMAMVHG